MLNMIYFSLYNCMKYDVIFITRRFKFVNQQRVHKFFRGIKSEVGLIRKIYT